MCDTADNPRDQRIQVGLGVIHMTIFLIKQYMWI